MKAWYEIRNAPIPGTELCTLAELESARIIERHFGNSMKHRFRLFVHRQDDGAVRAWHNECPHFSVPLNVQPGEFLTRNGDQYMCRSHYARFNLTDGLCTDGPCEGFSLLSIPVVVTDGTVKVAESD